MSTISKRVSTIAAAIVIAAISIYASPLTFTTTNQTANQITVTLNMQSGAQIPVTINPGQSVPTQLNGDTVLGLYLNGGYAPNGAITVIGKLTVTMGSPGIPGDDGTVS